MDELCAKNLCDVVSGELAFGSLPPLGGEWEPVRGIQLNASLVLPGEVLFTSDELDLPLFGQRQFAEQAFSNCALGVVTSRPLREPWAGTFAITVPDARQALLDVAAWRRQHVQGKVIAVLAHALHRGVSDGLHELIANHAMTQRLGQASRQPEANLACELANLDQPCEFLLCELPAESVPEMPHVPGMLRPDLVVDCTNAGAEGEASACGTFLNRLSHPCAFISPSPIASLPPRIHQIQVGDSRDSALRIVRETRGAADVIWKGTPIGQIGNRIDTHSRILIGAALEMGVKPHRISHFSMPGELRRAA